MQGFIVTDFNQEQQKEAAAHLRQWRHEGKLKLKFFVEEGLENAPNALKKIFEGANTGKM